MADVVRAVAFAASLAGAAAAAAAPDAHSAPAGEAASERWDLRDLYADVAAWDADASHLEAQLGALAACKGTLGDSAARLADCLELESDASKRLARLAVYASEWHAEDTGDAAALHLNERLRALGSRMRDATAFRDPEILRLGTQRVRAMLAQEPRLAPFRYPMERVLRRASHTLDDAGETLVARFTPMADAGAAAYNLLANADMPWARVRFSTGEEAVIDEPGYERWRAAPSRADRKAAMDAFLGTWRTFERTAGALLAAQLRQEAVYTRVRRYPSTLARALEYQGVPPAVVDALVARANANLPTLHRYLRLRARLLGVADMRYYDIYPPLVAGDYRYPYGDARRLVLEAARPLGPEYEQRFAQGLMARWADVRPRPRKQSGAHMNGAAYDVHPYVLLNHQDDYESLSTLAHEWGHAMHSVLANAAQPYATADYETFVAEIASTLNEMLLSEAQLRAARDDDERLFVLGQALERLRATFFRQAMFGEFEREIHARADRDEPLTGDVLTRIYCDVLKRYHGHAQGVVTIDDAYCIEWAFVPHFYWPFYVYQYATSIAASSLFAQRILAGEPGARERYLDLLRAGGSDDSYALVKSAGVDLAQAAPYDALAARMDMLMDGIEAILAKRR
jgi:oligoendopeptidase F